MPAQNGYPFWWVCCKVTDSFPSSSWCLIHLLVQADSAQTIVLFLCQMAAPWHKMLSAFSHDLVRSWVYLEATMNSHLRHLLNLAPGIVRNQSGLICQHIDSSDSLRLLKMEHASAPEVGKWVQVWRGIYKGDVGYMMSTKSGGVQLLLIPHLSQPEALRGTPFHSCSAPTLFDYEAIKRLYNIEPVHIRENVYSF